MKSSPIYLASPKDAGRQLKRVDAGPKNNTDEGWLQKLLFDHPEVLPVESFGDNFGPAIPLGREVSPGRGRIDNLYVSPQGYLTIVEAKLWKNPEGHRTVVAQIIDYAEQVAAWEYDKLNEALLEAARRMGEEPVSLEDRIREHLDEGGAALAEFQQALMSNLELGKFLLLIVGDRVHPNVVLMTRSLQSAPGLAFTLGLVELRMYKQDEKQDWPMVVVPDVVGRIVEKTRAVVKVQYEKERPSIAVESEDDVDVPGEDISVERFLAKVPEDLRGPYKTLMEEWKNLGGELRASPVVLYWEFEVGGEPRKFVFTKAKGESKGAVGVLPQQKYDKWAQWPELYEAYLDELAAAPVAAGVARKHKMWLQHEQVSAADLRVIIQAALHLAERIRQAEQGE